MVVIVELKRPMAVMRFAAQFKIERWSDGPPGKTITDSGTILDKEIPTIEYSKIQTHEEILKFIQDYDVPYVEEKL